jgi:hypothetical protein
MIGFVIPFKSRMRSKNWEMDCALLNRTISSVLSQSSKNYKCYVVYSDLPDKPAQDNKVIWVQFPFPFLESHQIGDEERCAVQYGLGKFLPNFYDQGKKSLYGSSFAKKDNCSYIMSLDADDLLSNKLVNFIDNNLTYQSSGWYVNKGYMYAEKSSFLLKVPANMNYVCASVNIIRNDLVPEPDFSKKMYQDFQFFSSHAYMPEGLKNNYNEILQPVPFYCTTYVLHNGNFFTDSSHITKISLKNLLKRLIRGKFLSRSIREEFGIYNLDL